MYLPNYRNSGKLVHTKRKTPKQREILKRLKVKQKNAKENASNCQKKLTEFEKKNQKMVDEWCKLSNKVDSKNSIVYDISFKIYDYEDQFKTYEDDEDKWSTAY